MFRIKICGITHLDDARAAARAGADAVGLNFYPRSPRYLPDDDARNLVAALPAGLLKVGLFVNSPAREIARRFDELPLDLIQLHGDEPPESLPELAGRPVLKAFRVGPGGLQAVLAYLERCRALNALPAGVLFDAATAGQYGGTGRTTDWNAARDYAAMPGLPPLVLAGGLTPENVAEAVRTVRPAAVDVAGGVESSPGRKDPAALAAFVRAARAALDAYFLPNRR